MKKEEKFWVEKSNILNELRPKGMTLNQIRFLAIYQAKINSRNPEQREVIFPLNDFVKIMDLKRLNVTKLKNTINELLRQIVYLPNQKDGFIAIPLFNECEVYKEDIEWFVKIECHQKAIPYMFEMKKNYFKYQLWNALRLNSINQVRMYEILKQYEKIGTRTVQLDALKEMLGIDRKQYLRYDNFNRRVLESCQKSLEINTDIKFEYIPIKTGKTGKITAIQFNILKNDKFKDLLQLDKFIDNSDLNDISNNVIESPKTLEDLYKKYFNSEQKEHFKENIKMALQDIYKSETMIKERTEIIYKQCITNFKINSQTTDINSPLAYMQGIINNIIKEEIKNPKKEKRRSYDINQFEKFAINYPELQKVENVEVSESHSEPVLEPVKETKVIYQEEIEKPVIEPVNAGNEDAEKMFEETEEGIALFPKILTALNKFPDYNLTIEILDLINKDWRKYKGFCKRVIIDKLKEKENAPELINIFN